MAELGVAYLSIVPSMKNVRRQIESAMVPAAAATSASVGASMGSRITSGLVTSAKVAGTAMTGVLGFSLVKGFQRLSAIENAKAKLSGLGNSATDTSIIMDNALKAVKGTAFGMDEAATTAASAVAAGIKPGQQLESYLGLVGDAATIAGVSMQDMGGVFGKVVTSGKVQGDTFQQMSDMGIPVVQMLAKTMGISAEEVYKLGSKGQISSDQFLQAMESMRGAAQKGGQTTTGAFKNMVAALSRFGAALLSGIYPAIGPVFNTLTSWIDKATTAVTPLVEALSKKIGAGLQVAGAAVVRFVTPLKDLMNLQVLTPDIVKRMGLSADSPLGKGMTELIGGIRAFAAAWRSGNGVVTSSGFQGFMQRAAFAVQAFWNALRKLDFSSWDNFKKSLGTGAGPIMTQFQSIGKSLSDLRPAMTSFIQSLPSLAGAVGTLAGGAITVLAGTLKFLADHVDTLIKFMPLIVAGFVAWRVATQAIASTSTALRIAEVAALPVQITRNRIRLQAATLEWQTARANAGSTSATVANTTATGVNNAAQKQGVLARVRGAAATVAHRVATVASSVAAKAAAGAQWLLNAALSANPIGIIVIALIALVAGLVVAYNRMGWFKDIVNAAWAGIKVAIGAVVTWFTTVALPLIRSALNVLGQVFLWLYENVIKPVWFGIQTFIGIYIAIVRGYFTALVWVVQNILAPIFTWLWHSIIEPVWNGIRWAIQFAWNIIQGIWNAIRNFINVVLVPVFHWLSSQINSAWNFASNVIRAGWNLVIKPAFDAVRNFINGVLVPVFNWLRDKIRDAWNFAANVIRAGWVLVIRPALDAVRNFINNVIVPVFNWLRDRIHDVWTSISNKIRDTWNWIRDHVLDPMGNYLRTTVVDSFNKAKDGIREAWNKIQDIVKEPVKFVINTVIRDGFANNFDKIADKFGVDKLNFKGVGWARGGVLPGYQSSQKDDVLTPMRSGEGVLVPEVVKGLGAGFVHGANKAGNSGGVNGVRKWADSTGIGGYANGGVVSPVHGRYPKTQGWNPVHMGVDIGMPVGTPVYATSDGNVTWAGPGVNLGSIWGGNEIHISGGGIERWFAHLSEILVHKGQHVSKGQLIGKSGNTGVSSGPHLHFGTFRGGYPNAINSEDYLAGAIEFGSDGGGANGGGGWLSALYDATVGKLLDTLIGKIPGKGFPHDTIVGGAKHLAEGVRNWVTGRDGGGDSSDSQVAVGGNVEKWRGTVRDALRRTGWPDSEANISAWLRQIQTESGGNPNAVQGNIGDVNNASGDLAKGLVQVIGSTFAANRDPSLPNNRFDPLANLVAGMNWVRRSGHQIQGWIGQGHGYAKGGIVPQLFDKGGVIQPNSGVQMIDHQRNTPDYVLTDKQWDLARRGIESASRGRGDVIVQVQSHEGEDPTVMGRRAGEALAFNLAKVGI